MWICAKKRRYLEIFPISNFVQNALRIKVKAPHKKNLTIDNDQWLHSSVYCNKKRLEQLIMTKGSIALYKFTSSQKCITLTNTKEMAAAFLCIHWWSLSYLHTLYNRSSKVKTSEKNPFVCNVKKCIIIRQFNQKYVIFVFQILCQFSANRAYYS